MQTSPQRQALPANYHIMTKPIGPICNLDCKYCFYLEKEKFYGETPSFRMKEDLLENYIKQYIESQPGPEITFAWQGGEPTLMGVDFFEKAVAFQARHCPPNKRVANTFQTNGTLLDDRWGEFLKQNCFLVGVSIDGPPRLHDWYRVDKAGKPTCQQVLQGIKCLQKHDVDFNTLTVVSRHNSQHPLEIYRFLKDIGSTYLQFIPLVERVGEDASLASPPDLTVSAQESPPVTKWSVRPKDYGDFLCAIFDEWVRKDVGNIFIQLFDTQLGLFMGMPASLCYFAETCGYGMAMEHNGDLYSCDHFVYPEYKLGNIKETPILELLHSSRQQKFGQDKRDALPRYCMECDVRFACNGECPKHRFMKTPDGEPGLNYLCPAYKKFLHHITPAMNTMAHLIRSGRPASLIMQRP